MESQDLKRAEATKEDGDLAQKHAELQHKYEELQKELARVKARNRFLESGQARVGSDQTPPDRESKEQAKSKLPSEQGWQDGSRIAKPVQNRPSGEPFRKVFDSIDDNKNGAITRDQLELALRDVSELTLAQSKKFLKVREELKDRTLDCITFETFQVESPVRM
eukprot:3917603-Rhodomonas_salina.1